MPKYVIERALPGAGKLTQEQLTAISQTRCGVLRKLGPEIQWVQSYVTDDKNLLHLHRPQPGVDSRARPPGRLPRQQRFGDPGGD